MSYTATHWIRIRPDGTREIWQGANDDVVHPSIISHCGPTCTHGRTWWPPLTDARLRNATDSIAPGKEPCLCVTVTERDGILDEARIVEMTDHIAGRPFMARFSWTMGLSWEPPYEARPGDDEIVRLYSREDGKLFATAKPGMSVEQAMHELRIARY